LLLLLAFADPFLLLPLSSLRLLKFRLHLHLRLRLRLHLRLCLSVLSQFVGGYSIGGFGPSTFGLTDPRVDSFGLLGIGPSHLPTLPSQLPTLSSLRPDDGQGRHRRGGIYFATASVRSGQAIAISPEKNAPSAPAARPAANPAAPTGHERLSVERPLAVEALPSAHLVLGHFGLSPTLALAPQPLKRCFHGFSPVLTTGEEKNYFDLALAPCAGPG
jgi:hypothetical protein